ncbi:circadian clock KaiB family protein [Microvirga sp. STS02]|uniref:circadian clock KaiB family protein n=1 Tax=Hymenobacter negativus TaxID=2795026 RepID=UPI0018DBB709|nr:MULTISPECIES: circadian clock KaiB family protein [Bacteria]MBH8568592.1 circadian clock KaiB family protein [Hymenobacter negativus]MBR7208326.1 circadian clock KaiB family protein [Microvirga sp. STS02]
MDPFTDPLAPPEPASPEYVLHLFITGATPNSTRAVRNIKDICEQYLKGRYELLIVDIYQQPDLAQREDLIGVPTLIKRSPGLVRRLVGDLSDWPRVLKALGITPSGDEATPDETTPHE